jgi:hypothetical protein
MMNCIKQLVIRLIRTPVGTGIESLQVEANGHSLQNRRIKLGIHYANTLKAYPSISARFGVFNPLY